MYNKGLCFGNFPLPLEVGKFVQKLNQKPGEILRII
jgi:hypothetical protein